MPRNYQPVEFNTFIGGLVTEASPLNFPSNASLDEENFTLNKDGSRSRRKGLQFESGYVINQASNAIVNGELVVSSFKWNNAGGLSTNTVICVQMGDTIDFFHGNLGVISPSKFFSYQFPGLTNIQKFSYASVDGKLVIANGQKQVTLFTYDTTKPDTQAITVSTKRLLIRDLFGIDDGALSIGDGVSTRPSGLTGAHAYNLRNRGWATPRPSWGGNDSAVDVLSSFTGSSGGPLPSNADNITAYIYANVGNKNGSKTIDRFDAKNIVSNPPANTEAPVGYFIIDALDRGNGRTTAVKTLAAKYPQTNSQVTSAILPVIKPDQTDSGATCISEFAGRVFYGGFPGTVINGDAKSPKLSSYLLYSQLVNDEGDINQCYQANDPTDPKTPDLLDTDGGFLRVEGAYGIKGLAVLMSTLFVLADNGVWSVSGQSGGGFTATGYQVNKLTDAGCKGQGSIVVMEDSIFYWGNDGIYAITRNQFGDFHSDNITNKTIKKFYMSISDESIRRAEGVYNSYDNCVKWMYNNYLNADGDTIELNLDVVTGAYYKYRIKPLANAYPIVIRGVQTEPFRIVSSSNNVVISTGDSVVVGTDNIITNNFTQESSVKEVSYLTLTDNTHYTFSGYDELFHYDWVDVDGIGMDAPAFLLTGVLAGGDYQRGKQLIYQTTHFGMTNTPITNVVLTSKPYPQYVLDSVQTDSILLNAKQLQSPTPIDKTLVSSFLAVRS